MQDKHPGGEKFFCELTENKCFEALPES